MTIIIHFENIADDNALFGKVKKEIIKFRNFFDTAIGLTDFQILKFSGGGGACPKIPLAPRAEGKVSRIIKGRTE